MVTMATYKQVNLGITQLNTILQETSRNYHDTEISHSSAGIAKNDQKQYFQDKIHISP